MYFCVILLLVQNALSPPLSNSLDVTTMSAAQLQSVVHSQALTISTQGEQIAALRHQLDWFRRQLFGQKSERFAPEPDPAQLHLGEVLPVPDQPLEKLKTIPAHTRRVAQKDGAESGEELKFFDESNVPVETIVLVHEETKELDSEEFELIGEKVSYRLAQRPGSYVMMKYVRPVMKRKDDGSDLDRAGPGGVSGRQPRGCELCRGAADGQVRLALAAVSPASAARRLRDYGLSPLAHAARAALDQPAGADLPGAVRLDPYEPREDHGRDPDQGRSLGPRQDADRVFLARIRRRG